MYNACYEGHDVCVAILLKHGADPNIADKDSKTPLFMASQEGHDKCVSSLLQREADFNIANKDNFTIITSWRVGRFTMSLCTDIIVCIYNLKCVVMLVEHGTDVNNCNLNGQMPLMTCALYGRVQIMSYLLANGANINVQNQDGYDALKIAYMSGHSQCVELLLQHGADESTLQGLEFGIYRDEVKEGMEIYKDYRRKARYCEYSECSSNKDEMDLQACVRCKLVRYCCREHQRLHWHEHKKKFKELIV